MKQITWAITLAVILLVGPALPAAAGGGGYHGGGGGAYHGGGVRWTGGGGGWHGGTRVYIGGGGWWGWPGWWGGPGWWGPGWWGPGWGGGVYAAPPVVIQPAPTEFIQQQPAPPQQTFWYFCQNAGAYYPYVKECPGGWMQVVPQPGPPTR